MLNKLIKYDLKWQTKVIIIFVCLGIIFCALGMLFALIPDSIFFTIIAGICKGASVAMFANALFNSLFRSWARIVSNLYKDESYLTHTLPVKRTLHLASKVISQGILIVTSGALLILSIFIMYLNKETIEYLKGLIQFTSDALNTSITNLLIIFLLLVLIELIFIAFCGNFGIVYGYRFNKYKTLMSVIFGIVAYFIENMILLVIFVIMSFFSSSMHEVIFGGSNIIDYSLLLNVSYICICVYVISSIALYLLTNYLFKKGVNID